MNKKNIKRSLFDKDDSTFSIVPFALMVICFAIAIIGRGWVVEVFLALGIMFILVTALTAFISMHIHSHRLSTHLTTILNKKYAPAEILNTVIGVFEANDWLPVNGQGQINFTKPYTVRRMFVGNTTMDTAVLSVDLNEHYAGSYELVVWVSYCPRVGKHNTPAPRCKVLGMRDMIFESVQKFIN